METGVIKSMINIISANCNNMNTIISDEEIILNIKGKFYVEKCNLGLQRNITIVQLMVNFPLPKLIVL